MQFGRPTSESKYFKEVSFVKQAVYLVLLTKKFYKITKYLNDQKPQGDKIMLLS